MAILNISGTINSAFSVSGQLVNAAQAVGDAVFTIDLRPTNPVVIVQDNLNYGVLGWNINDVVATIILVGPQGEIYRNEDFGDPDIVPAISRYLNKTITLPLDPLTKYTNILKGNYTLKISWYNSVLDEYYNYLKTYQYNLDPPTITNTTVSGPYTGILTSTDTTEYGANVYQIIREHRIQYPTQLAVPPPDIVSSNAEVQVTPIYTNEWTILISSFVEYRQSDLLRIFWEGEGEFTHCVFGGCIGAMWDAINTMLETYKDAMACNLNNQEAYQKRLVIVNTAWHLLNEAYWSGDAEEADAQSYVIQEMVEYSGGGVCGGVTSELVVPCPPWTGGGVGGTYTFSNALVESGGNVTWGGLLTQSTTVTMVGYQVEFTGTDAGNIVTQSMSAAAGIVQKSSNAATEGQVSITQNQATIGVSDLVTPANNRLYNFGTGGLVEAADYSAGYVALSLVNKTYVDTLFAGAATYTFENAITEAAGVVKLGGALTEETTIDVSDQDLRIRSTNTTTLSNEALFAQGSIMLSAYGTPDWTNTSNYGRVQVTSNYVDIFWKVPGGANDFKGIQIESTHMEVRDDVSSKGLENRADYSAAWTDHSLVTKLWVESNFATGTLVTTFAGLTDTPGAYTGFGGYFLTVNPGETAVEFVAAAFVPATGGTFTGQVTISTSTDRPLILKQIGAGSTPGTIEPGINLIAFQDNDGDEQGKVGIDASGNVILESFVLGAGILANSDLEVNGDISVSGLVDGVDIGAFYTAYGLHTHAFGDLTGIPTTLAGYGITDAMLNTADSWGAEFSVKASATVSDLIVIEDVADSNNKKYVSIGNLPTSAATFLALSDAPGSYVGQGGYFLKANVGETGLEFEDISTKFISTVAGTLTGMAQKVTPISNDVLIIEDSADSGIQKKILWSDIPSAGAVSSTISYTSCSANSTTDITVGTTGDISILIHYTAKRDMGTVQQQSGTVILSYDAVTDTVSYGGGGYIGFDLDFEIEADVNTTDVRLNIIVGNLNANALNFSYKIYSKLIT